MINSRAENLVAAIAVANENIREALEDLKFARIPSSALQALAKAHIGLAHALADDDRAKEADKTK